MKNKNIIIIIDKKIKRIPKDFYLSLAFLSDCIDIKLYILNNKISSSRIAIQNNFEFINNISDIESYHESLFILINKPGFFHFDFFNIINKKFELFLSNSSASYFLPNRFPVELNYSAKNEWMLKDCIVCNYDQLIKIKYLKSKKIKYDKKIVEEVFLKDKQQIQYIDGLYFCYSNPLVKSFYFDNFKENEVIKW